jgi:hypothetical protein
MYRFKLKEIESGEVEVYGYQTQHFDICPGAESLYKRIVEEKLVDNEDLVKRSAKLHDALFALEKNALERGSNELDIETAQLLADQIMAMAEMMDLKAEHQYIQGHVDKVKGAILKEIKVGDTDVKKGVKTTVSNVDPETGAITYDVENVANFSSTYNALQQAREFLDTLEKTGNAKDDTTIDKFAEDIAKLFNAFRSHVRKNYPKEYERVLRLKESITEAKNMTFGDFLDDLDNRFLDILRAAKGLNAENSNTISMRATINNNFTLFRNYISKLKKEYSDELEKELTFTVDEQSSTAQGGMALSGGVGAQYATPKAFSKNKKGKGAASIYYYKLGYKPVPKIKPKSYDIKKLFEYNNFQENRIKAFDDIEKTIETILPMLSNAKNRTAEYYNENPGSYGIKYPTDAILTELNDIIEQIKAGNENISQSI